MVCTSGSPPSVHRDWQHSAHNQEWPAPPDEEVRWVHRSDPSIVNDHNGHGHGDQGKIDYISYLISRNPHIGCRFCDVEDVSVIETSIPIWALQVMQPRPEGFIWEDQDAWPADPDGLGHICLSCYQRVLEFQLERPDWGKVNEGSEDSLTNGRGWDSPVEDEDDDSSQETEHELLNGE